MGDVENITDKSTFSPMKAIEIEDIYDSSFFINSFGEGYSVEDKFKELYKKYFLQDMDARW